MNRSMARKHAWVGRAAVAAAAVAATLAASPSRAAEVSAQDRALARGLFDQARALMNDGKHAEACPKLEESQRLDPGIGTQFNLASCYERTARLASAWSLYLEVAAATRAAGQIDREKVARDNAAALEPRLSRLAIAVAPERQVSGMTVKLDGTPVGKGAWGTPMPADSGNHKVEVSAPGRKTWTATVTVPGEKQTATVTVPELEVAPAEPAPAPVPVGVPVPAPAGSSAAPPPPAEAPPAQGWSTQKTAGLVVAGAGVVGLGVGSVLALGAKSHYGDSSAYCEGNLCTQQGLDIRSEARSSGTVATVVGGIGLLALGTGAVLFFTAPSSGKTPAVGVGPGWVGLKGAF
jgi:serine/threonine-protein kinase